MSPSPSIVALPEPYSLDWQGWADFVAGYNPGLLGELDPNDDWREFARRLCNVVPEAPQPDQFTDWRAWAAAVKLATGV